MRISRKELQSKFGLALPAGKFKVNVVADSYEIFTVKDNTEGCILVGDIRSTDTVSKSVVAFNRLFAKMLTAKDITLTIE